MPENLMPEDLMFSDSEHWMFVCASYAVTFVILAVLFAHSFIKARRNERQLAALRDAHSRDSAPRNADG